MTASRDLKQAGGGVVLHEPLLEDDYPIYAGYLYVADGKVVRSNWHGITARQFKGREGYTELRRCDIFGRQEMCKRVANADTSERSSRSGTTT